MSELPASSADEATHKFWFYSLHKTMGLAVLVLALVRIAWTLSQPHPAPLHPQRRIETLAAQTAHWTLYGGIILMPLTGWLHHSALEGFAPIWWPLPQDLPLVPKNSQLAEVFSWAHFFTGVMLGLTIIAHVAGALKHVVLDRDQTLKRMLPGSRVDAIQSSPRPSIAKLPPLLAGCALALVVAATAAMTITPQSGGSPSDQPQAAVSAKSWLIDHDKSTLAIEVIQSGKLISGSFAQWNAKIEFDPDNLEQAQVDVTIDTSSLSLGGVTQQATSADFLNTAAHPTARFVADKFTHKGGDQYEANGQLTLVDTTQPVLLTFQLRIENGRATVTGTAAINRLDFGIGAQGFKTDNMIGFEVAVKLNFEATTATDP